ncbi:hypothetical protein KL943_002450 [Ogataea angusta]|nr:hypothetical protein KL943_002450 [Ogataea angusta]
MNTSDEHTETGPPSASNGHSRVSTAAVRPADRQMSISAMLSSPSSGQPSTEPVAADGTVPSCTELMHSFERRVRALVKLDALSTNEINQVQLLENELKLLRAQDGIYVDPGLIEDLKTKVLELDPKIYDKLTRRNKLVEQESEDLRDLKTDQLKLLADVQREEQNKLQKSTDRAKPHEETASQPLMNIAPKKVDELLVEEPAEPAESLSDVADTNGDGRRKRKRKTRIDPSKLLDEEQDETKTKKRKKRTDDDTAANVNSVAGSDDLDMDDEDGRGSKGSVSVKEQKAIDKQYDNVYISIWKDLARKDGPKAYRMYYQMVQAKQMNLKKTSMLAARESRKWVGKATRSQKDLMTKARRSMREMLNFWKKHEREERNMRTRAEQEAVAKAKKEEEEREARRQSRKLNFLINQTELYSHFIGKKIKTDEVEGEMGDKSLLAGAKPEGTGLDGVDLAAAKRDLSEIDFESHSDEVLQKTAAANAHSALLAAQQRAKEFNGEASEPDNEGEMNFQNPSSIGDMNLSQPKLLNCTLKEYQMKGLNWLANLYEQGINGILADEMGLGKTVQSISVLAYLAETHNIWGPFLVVTPASTLHNWQQEITKFVPDFKVLPYWGSAKDRKVLRKFWDRKSIVYHKDSPFHVVVTSYQLVVADVQYFQKMKWQYMILDEAQAIKSSNTSRWKSLLSFQCRNRLLLTGTPIQNSMQELWALLHFIMPSLFDSHDEFSEWFSKDIEAHAQSNTQLNEQQLRRLHVILKPFMLRRIKKNVQSELGDKIEIDVFCDLTNRQKKLYRMLRSQINIMDLIDSNKKINSSNDDEAQGDSLMNVVMQFRKVCNHPDLFERADTKSSFSMSRFAETTSLTSEINENLLELNYTTRNQIEYKLPKLLLEDLLSPQYEKSLADKANVLEKLSIWNPENLHESDNFAFLRFINETPSGARRAAYKNVVQNAIDLRSYTGVSKHDRAELLREIYDGQVPVHSMFYIRKQHKELTTVPDKVYKDMYLNVARLGAFPAASAPPIEISCSKQRFNFIKKDALYDPVVRQAMGPLSLNVQWDLMQRKVPLELWPKAEMYVEPLNARNGFSSIRLPSMNRFVIESGKLAKLDEMLVDLKKNGHKCLIYFQMTKMMDLMEEFLTYRQYKYIRLDGSSKLSDRRDLVHDWQTKPELFIFLLSTRAGGLGINLTAADTVIFYDSDWNPTIDSQAMDRAHRLGQTRQVTVYRLLVRGTIEERMRDRAKQKEHVQQVVMEGKSSIVPDKKDANDKNKDKKEMAMWLLEDGEDEHKR